MSYLKRLLGHDEQIIMKTHQHWTAFLGQIWHLLILFVVCLAIAVGINLWLGVAHVQWLTAQQEQLVRVAAFVVLLTYQVVALLLRYLQWQAEQYVVTNLRVIQLSGILSKRVLDSSLEKVNDVMLEQSLFGRILDYGDLEILTASELAVNKFNRVARPLAFKGAMLNAKQDLEGTTRERRDDPTKLIEDLARLRDQGVISEQEFQDKKVKLLGEL